MSNNGHFIPRQMRAATNYAANMHSVLSDANYDPAKVELTDADVTQLGNAVAANQAALARVDSLTMELAAARKGLSGPKGTHRRMVTVLRKVSNKVRISGASNSKIANLSLKRKKRRNSRRNAPDVAPEFTVGHAIPGVINIRFRESGSDSPRAKAANAIGVHIAVVDASKPATGGEADTAHIKTVSRSPYQLDTKGWPPKVRLSARWVTARGETSPWSATQSVTVM
jgi:hypothetical protein